MDIFSILEEVQIIARNGLNYSTNLYDRERYERLLNLAAQNYSELLDLHLEDVRLRLAGELGHITPKVGADAAIFNQEGEILLMERVDGSGWCLPCGWVEPNERPADAAVREAWEETGLRVSVRQLVGVFSRPSGAKNGAHSLVAVVHLCDVLSGELTLSHEGTALRYWPLDAVTSWHATHETYARAAHDLWQSETLLPARSE